MLRTFILALLILSLFTIHAIEVIAAETQDIAVISVTPSPAEVEVGDLVNITVVVLNKGTESETFNITTYYDASAIGTETVVSLAPDTNASVTSVWNTTDIATGIYTLQAKVDPLPEETVTEDNMMVSPNRVRVFVSPYIAVVPASTVDQALTPGVNYTVSVYTDYTGDDVWGYEFTLKFNQQVLKGVEVVNGDVITEDVGDTMFESVGFDNPKGLLNQTGNGFFALPGVDPPVTSGPGILANITFTVVGYGDSYITFGDETRLIGFDPLEHFYDIITKFTPGVGHILGGYFSNKEVTHDIAVIGVTPSPTEVRVGDPVNITVIIENQGTTTEDVTVKVYRDYIPGTTPWVIPGGTKTVQDVSANETKSLVFVWNTTNVSYGNHTITAVAYVQALGEIDLADNMLQSDELVTVTPPEEQPIPIDLLIGVAIIAVVAIALIWYAFKRRSKAKRARRY